eukprot:COSAG02_NODE_39957_length_410_cov_3.533762_1_plen_73_part_10
MLNSVTLVKKSTPAVGQHPKSATHALHSAHTHTHTADRQRACQPERKAHSPAPHAAKTHRLTAEIEALQLALP